jgi:hypothetical protein
MYEWNTDLLTGCMPSVKGNLLINYCPILAATPIDSAYLLAGITTYYIHNIMTFYTNEDAFFSLSSQILLNEMSIYLEIFNNFTCFHVFKAVQELSHDSETAWYDTTGISTVYSFVEYFNS